MPNTGEGAPHGIEVSDVHVALGGAAVLRGVNLRAETGSALSILGPSGCGKTTLLRVLAGLLRVDSGEVRLGDRIVDGDGTWVPAERRGVGLVFQDWALFPHLTVAQNVAFGLPRADRPGRFTRKDQSRAYILDHLDMVGIGELADRMPGSLSGGQQQRVALARALAPHPSVLLLDEPFSSLDTNLRLEVRGEVANLLRELEVTSVFVTHDQDEAFVLGDEVAVMRQGVVVQQGAPADLYATPSDPWLAGFVGEADFVTGIARGDHAETVLGRLHLADEIDGEVDVLVRPEELRLSSVTASDGADEATIDRVEYYGHDTLYIVRFDDSAPMRARSTGAPAYSVGDRVSVAHSGVPTAAFRREAK